MQRHAERSREKNNNNGDAHDHRREGRVEWTKERREEERSVFAFQHERKAMREREALCKTIVLIAILGRNGMIEKGRTGCLADCFPHVLAAVTKLFTFRSHRVAHLSRFSDCQNSLPKTGLPAIYVRRRDGHSTSRVE